MRLVGEHVAHERAVDLELGEVQAREVAQRRLALPEVVEADRDARPAQLSQCGGGPLEVGEDRGLGDLEHQPGRRHAGRGHGGQHPRGEVRLRQVARRDVHRHAGRCRNGHAGEVAQCAPHHPVGERLDQPRALSQRQEGVGVDQAVARMVPAQQRLDADDAAVVQAQLGLVVQHELVEVHGALQLTDHGEPVGVEVVEGAVVAHDAVGAGLGDVHRDLGALEQGVGGPAVVAHQHEADAGLARQRDARQVEVVAEPFPQLQEAGAGRLGGVDVGEHDAELVAAEARDQVARPHGPGQPVAQRTQQRVAVAVAEGVVDLLEAVEVDDGHRPRCLLGREAGELALEPPAVR